GRNPRNPQSPGVGRRALEASDRLRKRSHVRARQGDAAGRGQGVPADAPQRRGLRRGTGADARARRLLQPGVERSAEEARNHSAGAEWGVMGALASLTLLADAVTSANRFIWAFATVYTIVIFAYIIMSWVRLPYSPWLSRLQRFLYDVCEPYLRLF